MDVSDGSSFESSSSSSSDSGDSESESTRLSRKKSKRDKGKGKERDGNSEAQRTAHSPAARRKPGMRKPVKLRIIYQAPSVEAVQHLAAEAPMMLLEARRFFERAVEIGYENGTEQETASMWLDLVSAGASVLYHKDPLFTRSCLADGTLHPLSSMDASLGRIRRSLPQTSNSLPLSEVSGDRYFDYAKWPGHA